MSKQARLWLTIVVALIIAFVILVVIGFATGRLKVIEQLSSGGYENE